MHQLLNLFIDQLGNTMLRTKAWMYISVILVTSFSIMKMADQEGSVSYLMWILASLLAFASVFVFLFVSNGMNSWLKAASWFAAFIVIPALLCYIGSEVDLFSPINKAFKQELKSKSYLIFFQNAPFFTAIFSLTSRRSHETKYWWEKAWIQKISVFRIALVLFVLMALIVPPLSTAFQDMTEQVTLQRSLLNYLSAALQAFLVYSSHYIYFYLNEKVFFKRIYTKLGLLPYLVAMIGSIMLLVPILTSLYSCLPAIHRYSLHPIGFGITHFSELNYSLPIIVSIFSFPIILLVEWGKKQIAIRSLEQQKTDAELALLKQQINPHFFFNTLNNLYALSLEQADETPDTILKLAKLMRFVIYKGQQNTVEIKDEIAYLEDYIDLQKIRFKQNIDIKFEKNIDNPSFQILPLLFVNLLENAFKHGIEPSEKDGHIHIIFNLKAGVLHFECRNSVDAGAQVGLQGGSGIPNLQKRLKLRYPSSHRLITRMDGDEYLSKLSIRYEND